MKWLTVRQLAETIQMSPRFIYDHIHNRVNPIPHHRFGRQVRFLESEVVEWARRQAVR